MQIQRDGYIIDPDRARLDLDVIHDFLANQSYWAQGRSRAQVQTALDNSLCFGVYTETGEQVGLARVVTDYATFAWICDVFIVPAHRGRGLGKWLVQEIVAYPQLQGLKQLLLATRDAHRLYQKYGGFEIMEDIGGYLQRDTL